MKDIINKNHTSLKSTFKNDALYITLEGIWNYTCPKATLAKLTSLIDSQNVIFIDFCDMLSMDFSFGLILLNLLESKTYTFLNLSPNDAKMLELIKKTKAEKSSHASVSFLNTSIKHIVGNVKDFIDDVINFCNFLGAILRHLCYLALHPSKMRYSSLMFHINESGFRALPVILLTCFIVSYAITLQGVIQMDSFGMSLLSVEITAKLALREIGPFILALVIAGRSASSFTAQIGVGNLTQETDAMKVMDFNIMNFLVIPRVLALIIVMPLMVFLADGISLLAGMFALKIQAGVTFEQYAERFYEFVEMRHFLVGLAKAPFFGAAIAIVGTFRGFNIKENTQNVGRYTTISVVNAMFWIIAINAIFSLITTKLDI